MIFPFLHNQEISGVWKTSLDKVLYNPILFLGGSSTIELPKQNEEDNTKWMYQIFAVIAY